MSEARTVRGKPVRYRRNCLECAAEYTYLPAGKDKGKEHQRGLFCSQPCRSKRIADSKPGPRSRLFTGYCVSCTLPFASKVVKRYCSLSCRPAPAPSPAMDRVCRLCGTQYLASNTGGLHKQYCSAQCKSIVDGGHKRTYKAARKAKLRGVTVENVDPYVVFERDGWRCQLCGIATPVSLRGSQEDTAPELDHVMPISKGGAHSYSNTQCACRKCNLCKRDNIIARKYYFDETLFI